MLKPDVASWRVAPGILARAIGLGFLSMLLALALAHSSVLAQGRLQTGTSGTVAYASGGSTVDERAALAAMRDKYNLRLTYAVHDSGAMVTNVALTVDDVRQGRVFALAGSGPQVYLKLPAGTYTVSAIWKGVEQRRRVTLDRSGDGRELFLYWIP
ncbi:hypothetical protein [Pseudoduganella umbonata]|uniref:Carboxypeptidase regulatory-like domain-containing protein n=1 Tax=Pseudoduganella umbonata TaxID=864828 RepID=A0A4P8HK76_9BURK|nr:hypothetical protein [Pseudoduganella umbonata]MBB3225211.1 hypothetical protein [Pseudoduganella umbonata]QCP09266.1 hypothetical protein FCL38_01560 [Pseudoduganella umbonata]